MERMGARRRSWMTYTDVYGNNISVIPENKYVDADLSHGNSSDVDANRFRYIPDDYELYEIKVHTLHEDDVRTMLSWPKVAKIFITVSSAGSFEAMERVEEFKQIRDFHVLVQSLEV